jgi:hypothetical protein
MTMKTVVEFYRVRDIDHAHAVVGRETVIVGDLQEAIAIGRRLSRSLDMPQRPDGMAVTDGEGNTLYSILLDESGDAVAAPAT